MQEKFLNEVFNIVKKANSDDVKKICVRISENNVKVSFKKKNAFCKNLLEKLKKFIKDNNAKIYVIDTSALDSKESMQLIKEAKKVILTNGVICEMDKYKKAEGTFGANIRKLSKESALDQKQEKYVCVQEEIISSYNDDNLINYCKKMRRKVILLTADNNLVNKAKVNRIKYIILERQKKKSNTKVEQNEKQVEKIKEQAEQNVKQIERIKEQAQQNVKQIERIKEQAEQNEKQVEKIKEQAKQSIKQIEAVNNSEPKDLNFPDELKHLLIKDNGEFIIKAHNTPYVRIIIFRNNQLLADKVQNYSAEKIVLKDKDKIYKIISKPGLRSVQVLTFEVKEDIYIEKIDDIDYNNINQIYREIEYEELADIVKGFLTTKYN